MHKERFIPLSVPNLCGNERRYVEDAVAQGWVSTGGAYITRLEKELAGYLLVEEVAACQSGTAGIHLSLVEAGVQPGDMVIVPTLTFIAAVNPVRYQYAEPVFMDCDDSLCMDPDKLECFCEEECTWKDDCLVHHSGRLVKAVVVVHVFGNLADMERIMEIAGRYRLTVIEDATEALGTRYTEGRYAGYFAGTIGDYGVYSFNGNKIITTGGGGAVTAKETAKVRHIRYLSTQAKDDALFYVHNEIGYNYRMTNVQAALGVAQMEELEQFVQRKNQNYDHYRNCLQDFPFGMLKEFRAGTYSNKWFYALELNMHQVKVSLREIILLLQERGIQTRAIWGLIHQQKPYQGAVAYQIEKAICYSSCVLNLPCSTQITEEEIRYVAEQVRKVLEESADEKGSDR